MFIKKETYRQGILLSTIFNVLSKGLVFFNTVLIAYFFGTSQEVDIYFYSYSLILLIVTYSSSINTSVIIPEAIRIRIRNGESESMNFVNYFLCAYMAIVVAVTILILINPSFAFASVSQYEVQTLTSHIDILLLVIPLLLLMTLATFLADVLVSYRFFTMPMIITSINAIVSMVCIIAFHDSLAIKSALAGLVASYCLNLCMLAFLMHKHLKWKFSLRLTKPERRVFRNLAFTQAGTLAASLATYAPTFFFSGWHAGVISALNFAQQIFYQPTALLTNQITIVSRIKLNELFVNRQYEEINTNFLTSLKFLIFLLVPISNLFFLYSFEIISVLFNRGSFDAASVKTSAMFLRYLSLSIPLMAMNNMVANLFFASQRLRKVMLFQIFSNILLALLIYMGIKFLGQIGYPVAVVFTFILNIAALFFLCRSAFPFVELRRGISYLIRILTVNLALYAVVEPVNLYILQVDAFVKILFGSVLYCVLLMWLTYRFRLNDEIMSLFDKLKQRLVTK